MNGRQFNRKIFLKIYSRADDDFTGFETTDHPELDELDDVDLDKLNDTLSATLQVENVKTIDSNNPFGYLDD